jgi:hypothetical protein
VREIVSVGENVLAHDPSDTAGLMNCMKLLAEDAQLRAKLGQAGRSTAVARFDRRRLPEQLIPIYREVSGLGMAAS